MFRRIRTQLGIVRTPSGNVPFASDLIRFNRKVIGQYVIDSIFSRDAEILSGSLCDFNPNDLPDPNIAMQIMDRSDTLIWSGVDANSNTIRDLIGYDPTNPFRWYGFELTPDIFDTYLDQAYKYQLFVNFFEDKTDLMVYDRVMDCVDSTKVRNYLKNGGIWILNTGVWNDCAVWKDDALWRDN